MTKVAWAVPVVTLSLVLAGCAATPPAGAPPSGYPRNGIDPLRPTLPRIAKRI